MKIYLVYAGSPDEPVIQSPYCITHNLYYYLKKRAEVTYYDWSSQVDIDPDPDDIVIGHPHYDQNTVIQKFFRSGKRCKLKCLIHPLHTVRINDNMPFDDLAKSADKIFSICGPYWYDTIGNTPFAHWKPKIIRLDMAVDTKIWPHFKRNFNEPGKRRIVYVGSAMPQKNLDYMYNIVKSMPDVEFGWYGGYREHPLGNLKNMSIVGWCDFGNEHAFGELKRELFNNYDIFLNVSISDANPTTLLEFCMAGGLIPICTVTSGYWKSDSFINITHNTHEAIEVIRQWLNKPSHDLYEMSLKNRDICEREYNWDKFCSTVWNNLL